MTREVNSDECKTALSAVLAKVASTTESAQVQLLVVRNEEVVIGVGAETLCAIPCHVLDGHESTIGEQNEVKHAVTDDSPVVLLNHAWENAEARGRRVAILEHAIAAFFPFLDGSIDSLLDFGAVEVDLGTIWEVSEAAREAQNVPQHRAGSSDLVDIPARISQQRGVVDLVLFDFCQ